MITYPKACLFFTRTCNTNCSFCNVIRHKKPDKSVKEWLDAIEVARKHIGFFVIFGGEPTVRGPELIKLCEGLNDMGVPYTLITNGIRLAWDKEYRTKLEKILPSISVSIDSFDYRTLSGAMTLAKMDVPDKVANIGVNFENYKQIPNIIRQFSAMGIWSITTPLHAYKNPREEWLFRGMMTSLVMDAQQITDWCDQMTVLKDDGCLMHDSYHYFKTVWHHPNLDWKCSTPGCITINADLNLLTCVDRELMGDMSLVEAMEDKKTFEELHANSRAGCPGCVWDHVIDCENAILSGTVEEGLRQFSHAQ